MEPKTVDELNVTALPDLSRHAFKLNVVVMADGSVLQIPVNVVAGNGVSPCFVVVAGIHGDEMEGVLALTELWEELKPDQLKGRLVIVPVANPPAFAARQRVSPLDGLDLNRIFPGNPSGLPSEQLAHRLFTQVVSSADFLFTMHSWFSHGNVIPYVEVFEQPSAAMSISFRAALASGFDHIRLSDWPKGLLTRVANEADIPGIEAEVGGMGVSFRVNCASYRRHVVALMRHLGMSEAVASSNRPVTVVKRSHVLAPLGGIVRLSVKLGQQIEKGHILGSIYDLHGNLLYEVRAKHAGIVAAHRTSVSVNPGDHLFALFREIAVPDFPSAEY
jgi:predicted deacylase